MCIKLTYIRSLLKYAAQKFVFGKSTKLSDLIEGNHYVKNQLVENENEDTLLGSIHIDDQPNLDARAEKIIEAIAQRAELNSVYKISAFELWRSMQRIKKYSEAALEAQVAYCLYSVALTEFCKKNFKECCDVQLLSDGEREYCLAMAMDWMSIRRMVTFQLLTYPKGMTEAGLDAAATLLVELYTMEMDFDMRQKLVDSACDIVKSKSVEDEQLEIEDINLDCSVENVLAIIGDVVARSEVDVTYTDLALELWVDLSTTKCFGSKDIRAQASACVYAVAFRHFTDRDFDQYTTAPQPHLRECRIVAHDWFFIRNGINDRQYSAEVKQTALDTSLAILDSQVNYRGGGTYIIRAAALYISYNKHNHKVQFEDMDLNAKELEETKKMIEDYIN